MSTNGSLKNSDKKATLKRFPMTVQFNQNSIATIISFKEVTYIPGVRITTEKNQERVMTVTITWKSFKFKECESRLCFYDIENKGKET